MSVLDNILGNNSTLSDKDIASDMLKDSKFGVTALSAASTEAVNLQLRQIETNLKGAVDSHHKLSDLMINKDWYPAFSSPEEQLKNDYQNSKDITNK